MATFVLVHGAWAGALIWRPIAQALRKAGHEVYTPTLTGIGERRHLLNREIDLGTHTQDVLHVIDYEDLADIVLVGHSYGGMVITGVADAAPDKIASLIYLDAFVPEDRQSLFGMLPPDRPHATAPGEEWLTAPLPVEAFGKVSQQVRDFMARKGMSQPTACFSQSVKLTGGIDRHYIEERRTRNFRSILDAGLHHLLRHVLRNAQLQSSRRSVRFDHAFGQYRLVSGEVCGSRPMSAIAPRRNSGARSTPRYAYK
jgi:pimeloyl-ACP methyl ester carboxylesterase